MSKKYDFAFCPFCAEGLTRTVEGHLACGGCEQYVHWNNPAPCVAMLLPVVKLDRTEAMRFFYAKRDMKCGGGIMPNAIVLVQRGIEPEKGKWCLPCGFVDQYEDPWVAAKREAKEEAQAEVEFMQLLHACTPEGNQLIIFYMGRLLCGGTDHGSDATAVGWFRRDELPEIAFDSHKDIINGFFEGRWSYEGNMSARICL